MIIEVKAAAEFIAQFLNGKVLRDNALLFKDSLIRRLTKSYHGHWFPDMPLRGSAFRCIHIDHVMDPILASAAVDSGISNLSRLLPREFTVWIDPEDVSYRIGDLGSVGLVYTPKLQVIEEEPEYSTSSISSQQTKGTNILSSCKDQLSKFSNSGAGKTVFAPMAAFVYS